MKCPTEAIVRAALFGTLYLVAAPVYLALGIMKLGRTLTAFSVIGSGRVICFNCGHENVLNRFATCNKCHATEYGSILYCSFCRQVSRMLTCEQCSVTIRVIPEGWW